MPLKGVVVHPIVLLSAVDHFNRMSKIGNQKRVVIIWPQDQFLWGCFLLLQALALVC